MKNKVILSLFTASLLFACNPPQNVDPNASPSASASVSSSVSPSGSTSPSASVDPSQSPSASPSMSTSPSPSVTTSSVPVTTSCVDLVVGQEYDSTVFNMYCPPTARVGTKWTYSTTNAYTGTMDLSVEVVGMQGNTFTVRTTAPNIDRTDTSTNSGYQDIRTDVKFKFIGLEDVTVGAGSYTAAKLTTSQTDSGVTTNLTYWVAKNVGVVRVKSDTNTQIGNISTTTDLKAFNL